MEQLAKLEPFHITDRLPVKISLNLVADKIAVVLQWRKPRNLSGDHCKPNGWDTWSAKGRIIA